MYMYVCMYVCMYVWRRNRQGFGGDVDHIFALSEILSRRRARNGRMYLGFLDIRKAYDTVWRNGMWMRMKEAGVKGKMLRILQKWYEEVESRVEVNGEVSEWFNITDGVRQGCVLSPLLFLVFIQLAELFSLEFQSFLVFLLQLIQFLLGFQLLCL